MTAVPSFPVVPFTAGGDPSNPKAIPVEACDWTETNCINKDIIQCPKGVWGLTYDDGPTEFSEKLYDVLDKTNQKATLFYIGSNIIQNWQAARRACGAGHQIAVHTWSHHPSTSLTNEQFVAEVKYTEMAIKEICGFTPTYFRVSPPTIIFKSSPSPQTNPFSPQMCCCQQTASFSTRAPLLEEGFSFAAGMTRNKKRKKRAVDCEPGVCPAVQQPQSSRFRTKGIMQFRSQILPCSYCS